MRGHVPAPIHHVPVRPNQTIAPGILLCLRHVSAAQDKCGLVQVFLKVLVPSKHVIKGCEVVFLFKFKVSPQNSISGKFFLLGYLFGTLWLYAYMYGHGRGLFVGSDLTKQCLTAGTTFFIYKLQCFVSNILFS